MTVNLWGTLWCNRLVLNPDTQCRLTANTQAHFSHLWHNGPECSPNCCDDVSIGTNCLFYWLIIIILHTVWNWLQLFHPPSCRPFCLINIANFKYMYKIVKRWSHVSVIWPPSTRGRFGQVHKCMENSSGLMLAAKIIKARSQKEKVGRK